MSKIEWTDATWNPIRARNLETGRSGHYCVHVSEGCRNCYAERMQPRFGNPVQYRAQDRAKVELYLDRDTLAAPLKWKKPRDIFVCSMTDLFLEHHSDAWIDAVLAVMALCPQHRFQVLTKRSARMRDYMAAPRRAFAVADVMADIDDTHGTRSGARFAIDWSLPNLWLGVSIEDRLRGVERAWNLALTPAAVRFWSVEPLLEDLGDLTPMCLRDTIDGARRAVDWVICGGESGPNARPMHPDWARSIRDQCVSAGVPFFFKQWGEFVPVGHIDRGEATDPNEFAWQRVGKKRAGRMLDGRTWDEMP